MIKYIIHDDDGNIISCGKMSQQCDQRIDAGHTQVNMDFPDDIENYKFDISTKTIVRIEQTIIDDRETQKAWEILRGIRASILSKTDWTQVPDVPLTDAKKQEWATYRQTLRDLPANTTDPSSPTWPTQPS